MNTLQTIEAEAKKLPREELLRLQDWLAEYLENEADLTPAFVASIERGKADLQAGRVRQVQN